MAPDLWLAFFDNFKWGDTVLLSGSQSGMCNLAEHFRTFARSGEPLLSVHAFASVSRFHPTQLYVLRSPDVEHRTGYTWVCPSQDLDEVIEKLWSLTRGGASHQYFDLYGSEAQLMVSTGEYNDLWP